MKKPGKQDFRLQTLKLLEGLNRVVSSQAGDLPHAPFSLHPRPTTKKQGGRVVNYYWTSSQKPNGYFTVTAYFRLFGEGTGDAKEDIPCRVRAIRAL